MRRDRVNARALRRMRTAIAALVGVSAITVMAPFGHAHADPTPCEADDEGALRAAAEAFVAETNSCTVIAITDSFALTAPITILNGDIDVPSAVDTSLTIQGNGNVLTSNGTHGGLLVFLGATQTLTIDSLGMDGFGGWGAVALGPDSSGRSAELVISRSRFTNNAFATPTSGMDDNATAGAVNTHGPLTILDSEFSDNDGEFGGAVHNASAAPTFVSGSTFAANGATSSGGAIYVSGSLELENSTITGNTANQNSAVVAAGGLTITFCTIVDNVALEGMANAVLSSAGLSMFASIVTNNVDGSGVLGTDITASESPNVQYSLLSTPLSTTVDFEPLDIDPDDTNVYGADPELMPLGDYGGFTLPGGMTIRTRPPRSEVIIDIVEQSTDPSSLTLDDLDPTDQRGVGFSRYVNGRADFGAVEFRPATRPPRPWFDFALPELDDAELPDTQ